MRTQSTLTVAALLAAGTLLGWLAASDRLSVGASARDTAAKPVASQPTLDNLDRTVLPIAGAARSRRSPRSTPARPRPRRGSRSRPRQGRPNVVIVLIDDIGFGHSSAFGGPCQMPTCEQAGEQRAALQSLPHDGPLLADADGSADRPQPPRQQRRRHHGTGDGLPRQHGRAARRASRRWRRSCARTATAPRPSASITRRRRGKPRSRGRSIAGRRARGSTSSTASSAARRTSGRRRSTTASPASRCRTTPTTTSPPT